MGTGWLRGSGWFPWFPCAWIFCWGAWVNGIKNGQVCFCLKMIFVHGFVECQTNSFKIF